MQPLKGNDLVAQLVEHLTFNQRVLGSNPSQITTKTETEMFRSFFLECQTGRTSRPDSYRDYREGPGFDPDSYRDQPDHNKD